MTDLWKGYSLRCAVKWAVDIRVAHCRLDVFAGFGEGDGLDEFLDVAVFAGGLPIFYPVVTGVVGGECIFEASELVHHGAEVAGAKLQVNRRREKLLGREGLQLFLFGYAFADAR